MRLKHTTYGMALVVSLAACGDASDLDLGADAYDADEALSLRDDQIGCYAASELERTAVELARLTLHRAHRDTVRGYARAILQAHEALYVALRQVGAEERLPVSRTMSLTGEKMWGALFNQGGQRFEAAFLGLQGKLQTETLTQLRGLRAQVRNIALQGWIDGALAQWRADGAALAAVQQD
jgi:predicted outer membrane protein